MQMYIVVFITKRALDVPSSRITRLWYKYALHNEYKELDIHS